MSQDDDVVDRFLLAIPREDQLRSVLKYLLDEEEFLSPYGIRSLSKASVQKYSIFSNHIFLITCPKNNRGDHGTIYWLWNIREKIGQYHVCWCLGPNVLPRQQQPWYWLLEWISRTCEVLRNDRKCRHIPSDLYYKAHQISKLKCFSSHLAVVFAQSIEARGLVENEYVVGAVPTGNAATTSEWSASLLPTMLHLILEIWW